MPKTSRSREPERQFRVQLPLSYAKDARIVSFTHRSDEWANLDPKYVDGNEVRIPE